MRVDEPITVYSPFLAEEDRTPEQAEASYDQCHAANRWDRDNYLALPWAMQDLVGTIWRNVHAGSLKMINALQMDQWGQPQLPTVSEYSTGYLTWTLGLWLYDRYIVDDCMRVDHLSLEEQLVWFGFRVGHLREIVAWQRRQSNDSPRITQWPTRVKEKDLPFEEQELFYAEQQMQVFAQKNNLSIPPEILHYKVEPCEQRWDRIALLYRKQRSS